MKQFITLFESKKNQQLESKEKFEAYFCDRSKIKTEWEMNEVSLIDKVYVSYLIA